MLTAEQISIVKSTIPTLVEKGVGITEHFYKRMFKHHPELQHLFNASHQRSGDQPRALFDAIAAYAMNIETPENLTDAVERIAHKHTSLDVQPGHYPIVGENLIETLGELLGEAFTSDIKAAWEAAYQFLADIFIQREAQIYEEHVKSKGGWKGARLFRLVSKQKESRWVTSLHFEPVDGEPIMSYRPGQYLGIKVSIPGKPYQQIRQYSLSNKFDGKAYRISIKKEGQKHPGLVSHFLTEGLAVGDEVELFAPAGDFCFENRNAPITLISAGVGLTPMQAIVESLAEQKYEKPITYLHACESPEEHSFEDRVKALSKELNIKTHCWYRSNAKVGSRIHVGHMVLAPIQSDLPLKNGDFYLCGPTPFMGYIRDQLVEMEVPEERIFYENFGPHKSLGGI